MAGLSILQYGTQPGDQQTRTPAQIHGSSASDAPIAPAVTQPPTPPVVGRGRADAPVAGYVPPAQAASVTANLPALPPPTNRMGQLLNPPSTTGRDQGYRQATAVVPPTATVAIPAPSPLAAPDGASLAHPGQVSAATGQGLGVRSAVSTGAQVITPEQAAIQAAVLQAGPDASDATLAKALSQHGTAAQVGIGMPATLNTGVRGFETIDPGQTTNFRGNNPATASTGAPGAPSGAALARMTPRQQLVSQLSGMNGIETQRLVAADATANKFQTTQQPLLDLLASHHAAEAAALQAAGNDRNKLAAAAALRDRNDELITRLGMPQPATTVPVY